MGQKKRKKRSSTSKNTQVNPSNQIQVKVDFSRYREKKEKSVKKKKKMIVRLCFICLMAVCLTVIAIFQYKGMEKQLKSIQPSGNMTNEISDIFSVALMSGKEEVDLSNVSLPGKELTAELVGNAYKEACFQSPYLIGTTENLKEYNDTTQIATIEYTTSEWQRNRKQARAVRKVRAIVKDKIRYGMDDLQKAQILNDYLCDTITYSERSELLGTAADIRNIYGALIEKKVVCLGYAYAYKALMDEVGIPCVVVVGYARSYHAWNKIQIDGRWRVVDVTWNDTSTNQNKYFNLTDAENEDHEQYDYFVLKEFVKNYIAN